MISAKVVISTESFEELLGRIRPRGIASISARFSFWAMCRPSYEDTSSEVPSGSTLLSAIGIITFAIGFVDGESQSVPVRFVTVRALDSSVPYEYGHFVAHGQEYCEEISAQLSQRIEVSSPPVLCGVSGGKDIDWFFAVGEL